MGIVIRVILTLALIYLIVNVAIVALRNPKNARILSLFDALDDEALFESKFNNFEKDMKNPEFLCKGYVIKLWFLVLNKKSDEEIEDCISKIHLGKLLKNTGRLKGVDLNEDSFYYTCIAIPNRLYSDGRMELAQKAEELNESIHDDLENRFVYQIGVNLSNLYNGHKAEAQHFFEGVREGDYRNTGYSKQMILMLKNLCTGFLAKIYMDQNDSRFDELLEDLKEFYKTRMGKRFLSELHLNEKLDNYAAV